MHEFVRAAVGFAVLVGVTAAEATPVVVSDPFYFRERRSANDIGFTFGDRLVYGANSVLPDGDDGTTATRAFGSNAAVDLPFNPRSVNPHQFSGSVAYTPGRAALPANMSFTNSPDTTNVTAPAVGTAGSMPFARAINLNGTGTDLTFNWTLPSLPAGVDLERSQIRIFDLQNFTRVGDADVIHTAFLTSAATTSYTIPGLLSSGLSLELGHAYTIGIRLEDLRSDVSGAAPARLTSSEAYFNFTPTTATLPPDLFLPVHAPGSSFVFDIPVVPGKKFFVDPPVSVGYDYQIGAGNPNFQSVTLPVGIGDNLYDLFLFDIALNDWVDTGVDLAGGVEHDFGSGGVDRFRILGIESSAGLDPNDPLAFATGLTFTTAGDFTGAMTAIAADVSANGTPEPSGLLLMLAALVTLPGVLRMGTATPANATMRCV